MKSLLFAFPFLFGAGIAASQSRPPRLVANPAYEARGSSPGWQLAIGDRIALRMDPVDAESFVTLQYFPRVRSHNMDGVRRWESRTAGGAIMVIEARQEPCTLGDTRFRDSVTVTQGPTQLTGCGGPRLSNPG
jgi:hypothetical protein